MMETGRDDLRDSNDDAKPSEGDELGRVRSEFTRLVELRLERGLSSDEELDYRRLTEIERVLIRNLGPSQRGAPTRDRAADPADG